MREALPCTGRGCMETGENREGEMNTAVSPCTGRKGRQGLNS